MKCPNCQSDIGDDSIFCSKCGIAISSSEESPQVQTRTILKKSDEFSVGTEFAGKYQIQKVIGRGGMGVVYKALDTKLKRPVALKFLPSEFAMDEESLERFVREAQSAAALAHPNICTIYEIEEAEGKSYIAMEYIEGSTLREKISAGPLGIDELINIGTQAAQGVQAAHEKDIIHRDIKSSNIMIPEKGPVKVMDFGLAKSKEQKQVTAEGATLGTVAYMSPEQTKGKNVDHRTDIWSLGVVLYEMATGQLPFHGERHQALFYSILHEEPELVSAARKDIPAELEQIIGKCLAKDASLRYQHAEELIMDLHRLQGDEEIEYSRRAKNRKKRLAYALLTMVVAIAVLITLSLTLFTGKKSGMPSLQIAVAHFQNETGDASLDYFSREIKSWLVEGLYRTGLVSVLPLSEIETEDEVRAKKRSDMLVSGSFFLHGENLEFMCQIIDPKTGEVLQAFEPIKVSIQDSRKALELIRQRMMGHFAVLLDSRFHDLAKTGNPPAYDAWQEYMQGVWFEREDNTKALEHYKKAIELDSNFREPLDRIFFISLVQRDYEKCADILEEIKKSREHWRPGERQLWAWGEARLKGDNEGQYQAMKKAVRYYPWYRLQLASDAIATKRPKEAIQILNQPGALAFNPSWERMTWERLTRAYHMLGDHKQELIIARKGREEFPGALLYEVRAIAALGNMEDLNEVMAEALGVTPPRHGLLIQAVMILRRNGHRTNGMEIANRAIQWYQSRQTGQEYSEFLGDAFYYAEQWAKAREIFEKLDAEYPDNIEYLGRLGMIAARLAEKDEAERIKQELEKKERPYIFGSHTYYQACISALLGEKEQAMTLLQKAYRQGFSVYYRYIFDPNLESLFDYPPFKKFIKPRG